MNITNLIQTGKENLEFIGVSFLVMVCIVVLAGVSQKLIHMKHDARIKTRKVAFIGIFSAISAVLMLFEIPLFFAPGFYKIDLSEVPVLICAFAYGPVAGVVTEFLKVVLHLLLKGTSTAFVGDLANFVVGVCLVLPASIVYHVKKTRQTALIGMGVGTLIMTIFGSFFNAVYLIPTFAKLFGMPIDAIISMGTAVNPAIVSVGTLALFAVVPFNIVKGVIDSVLTFLLYKKLSPVIHKQHENAFLSKK